MQLEIPIDNNIICMHAALNLYDTKLTRFNSAKISRSCMFIQIQLKFAAVHTKAVKVEFLQCDSVGKHQS